MAGKKKQQMTPATLGEQKAPMVSLKGKKPKKTSRGK